MTTPRLYIRQARRKDIDTIYQWRHETAGRLAATHNTDQWSPPYPRENLENWVDRGETFMVALEPGGEPVATITSSTVGDAVLWTSDERAEPAHYVSKANVIREHAGRGIGATLFAWTRHRAAEAGVKYVRIDVWATNEKLQDYYRHIGFRYLRTVTDTDFGALFEADACLDPDLPVALDP